MQIVKFKNYIYESKSTNKIKEYRKGDYVIRQGTNSQTNDMLTMELSKETDIFLHVKGFPGSHVVITSKDDEIVPNEIIKFAAELACKNSKAPKNLDVDVVYCKIKFVGKTPDMPPGKVSVEYKNSDIITIFNK